MQTKKGPSWANGVSPEASTSATKLDDSPLLAEDEPPAEEGLSDMEWMRRRMTETTDTAEQDIKVIDRPAPRFFIFYTSSCAHREIS